jgi:hypothetical protein
MNFKEKVARFLAPDMMHRDQVETLVKEEVQKARMAIPINIDYDPKGEGYRRLTTEGQEQVRRDLTPMSQDLMLELAYYLYDTSGLVKRFVRDTKNFILGEGVTYSVANDTNDGAVKQVLDDFWNDSMNQMDLRLDGRIEFLGLLGEQCWPVAVNPHNGRVWVSYADPANIDTVYTVRDFPEMTAGIKLKGSAGRSGKVLPAIREEISMMRPEYGCLVGECFYFAVNKPPNALRGRSDMIHLFDFINGFEEGIFDELDRIKLIKSFIWDVQLEGADDNQIKEFLRNNRVPKSGSVRAHNERVTWTAVAPRMNQSDNKEFFNMMKTYLSACMNRPDSWLGSGGKAYQQEADLMGEPTFKDLGSRQRYVKYILEYMLRFVVDQAVLHKALSKPKEKYQISVDMPEMSSKDLKKIVDGLLSLAQALMIAEGQGWIIAETAGKIFANVAGQAGVEIDAAEEIKKAVKGDGNVTEDYDKRESLINDIVARIERQNVNSPGSGKDLEQSVEISDGENTIAKVSLNGAQITSLLKIIQDVAAGILPRESALNLMISAFPFSQEQAEGILGSAGKGFKIKPEDVK